MKKLVLLIMLIMCTSAFSTNVENPHILTSSEYRDCDDDNDDYDDEEDEDDDHPALPIDKFAYILLIVGCIYIFKTTSNKKE